jgi:hypothetical protein
VNQIICAPWRSFQNMFNENITKFVHKQFRIRVKWFEVDRVSVKCQ